MENLKFKRGQTPRNEIIGKAHKLGLKNEPSPMKADCCFIEDGWISFGDVGSTRWDRLDYREISEKMFMSMTSL